MSDKLTWDLILGKNELSEALKKATKEAINLEDILTSAAGVFAGSLAIKGVELVGSAFVALTSTVSDAINAAAASEVAINNLNAALGRAGNNTAEARESLALFASELQRTTTFEDDAAFSSLALLQSLTKLNTEGLKSGVTAAADLATVLGIDLESATRLVAKGAEGNVEAFKRYGIEIQKGSNDTETFANLIEKLNAQFGGAANSQLSTYAGSLKVLKNNIGDLQESLGGFITNNTTIIALFNVLSGSVANTSTSLASMQSVFSDTTKSVTNFALAFAETSLEIGNFITLVLEPLAEVFIGVGSTILAYMVLPIEKVLDGIIALGSAIPALEDTFKKIENPLSGASESIRSFGEEAIKSAATFDGNLFGDAAESVRTFADELINAEAQVSTSRLLAEQANKKRKETEENTNSDILKQREQLGLDLQALQLQLSNEEKAFNDALLVQNQTDELAKNQAQIEAIYNQKIAEADAVLQGELLKNQAIKDAQTQALADQKAYDNFKLAAEKATNQKIIDGKKLLTEEERRISKEREANQKDTIATIATLSQSGNKTLAAIGKAAGITQIAIDTPVAISKALAAFPPPFNFAAATAVGAAMAAQASRIAGVQFENGGVVGQGASVGPDNRVATIRDGELILNANQQKKLFDAINSGNFGGGEIVVQIDGREIARAVRDQINNGFRLA